MKGASVVAIGAISPLGRGVDAYRAAQAGEPARVAILRDRELEAAGLARPFAARVSLEGLESETSEDRATRLLRIALVDCASELDRGRPGWRSGRVGLAIGTSSGGMRTAARLFETRLRREAVSADLAIDASYFGPLVRAALPLGVDFAPATQILGACVSSSVALGVALLWLELGRCDLVLAGGYDAVSTFVAGGFEALRATSAGNVRPFRKDRDGMVLGEGAAVVALVRADEAGKERGTLLGFGASTDAVHMTAPDREGRGLALAAARALASAGVASDMIDLVSAHGTATLYNDSAEARAITSALGTDRRPVVHPFKAQIGHTLGAAGVLETLAALDALEQGVAPAAAGSGPLDPDCPVHLLDRGAPTTMRAALKLSAAFGGANAALVLSTGSGNALLSPDEARPSHPIGSSKERLVAVRAAVQVERGSTWQQLAEALGAPESPMARLDQLGRLGITAVLELARLLSRSDPLEALEGAGIVVGHAWATLGTSEQLNLDRLERGDALVEARRFPATSPNAVAGECAIRFRLTGPSFAVGAGLHGGVEALAVARDLVAAGNADRIVVLSVDDDGLSADLARAVGVEPAKGGACAALIEVASTELPGPLLPTLVETWDPGVGGAGKARKWGSVELLERLRSFDCVVFAAG